MLLSAAPAVDQDTWYDHDDLSALAFGPAAHVGPKQQRIIGYDGDTSPWFAGDGSGVLGDATPTGLSYLLYEHWGGAWCDAEKLPPDTWGDPPGTGDDFMCWAGAASNVLEWTGWGLVDGMTDTDEVFQYFQDHWTDYGGLMEFGWDWWFDGTNNSQGPTWEANGWSQVDVPGGGFLPDESFNDYYHEQGDAPQALSAIDEFLHAGYGTTIGIFTDDGGGHAITVWGYNYQPDDPSSYLGIWVTDSDDNKYSSTPPDALHYYEVQYSSDRWFLQDYYGSYDWYIDLVSALAPREPAPAPSPETNEIRGTVFNDANRNGLRDDGEPGLDGQTVFLDANGNGMFDGDTVTVHSDDVPMAIPDHTTVTSSLVVSDRPTSIGDLNVTLDISHFWDEDLAAYLISPAGTRVELFTNVGGWGRDFRGTTLDDEADVSITDAFAPFSGSFRPEGQLAGLDGEDPNGTWTLEVIDGGYWLAGTLNTWSLEITAEEPYTQTAADGSYALADLADGTYWVRHELPEGWTHTDPADGVHVVSLENGTLAENVDFAVAEATKLPEAEQLGTIDFLRIDGLDTTAGDYWYCFQSTRQGYLTVEAVFEASTESLGIALYDADFNPLDTSHASTGAVRIDWDTAAEDTYYLGVIGNVAEVDLRLANLLRSDGGSVTVHGTGGDDLLRFAAAGEHRVTINDVLYLFDAAAVTSLEFDAGEGENDAAELSCSVGEDTVWLYPNSAELSGSFNYDGEVSDYYAAVTNVAAVTIQGTGTGDVACLYDSPGDDVFEATPEDGHLYGNGFSSRAQGFGIVLAYAKGGGNDRALLYDSAGDDVLNAWPHLAWMSGDGFFNRAKFFETVTAYASRGGDYAQMYDSAGDDTFTAAPGEGHLYGAGFSLSARGFNAVHAYAECGGTDVAFLYDSAGDDTFVATPTFAKLTGPGFYSRANSFDYAHAYSKAGGNDHAYLVGSAGDDTFTGTPTYATLDGDGFYNRAKFFESVFAHAGTGGDDRAYLYDSAGDDHLEAADNWARLTYAQAALQVQDFPYVQATSDSGGTDTKDVDPETIDFLLATLGDWADV